MQATADFRQLRHVLLEDYRFARQTARTGDERDRRSAFRAGVAAVEGVTAALKLVVVAHMAIDSERGFSPEEAAMLREEAYSLVAGQARRSHRYPAIKDNIPFAMSMFAKLWERSFELDRKSSGWQALSKSVDLRHRVTHPKRPSDLSVSEHELQMLDNAVDWFDQQVQILIHMCEAQP